MVGKIFKKSKIALTGIGAIFIYKILTLYV